MNEWLDRNFVLGWVIASVINFAVAGLHVFLFLQGVSAVADVVIWSSLGLFCLSLAIAFRSRTKSRAARP